MRLGINCHAKVLFWGIIPLMTRRNRIPITEEIRNTLIAERDRTGIGPQALLNGKRHVMPKGLYGSTIQGWIRGASKSARKDYLDFALDEWAKLPDLKPGEKRGGKDYGSTYVEITQDQLVELHKYRELAFLPSAVFKLADEVPPGLTSSTVSNWLTGSTVTAQPDHLSFVFETCRKLESHPQRPVVMSDAIRKELQDLQETTGISGAKLLAGRQDIPDGLKGSMISAWINGYVRIVQKDRLDYVRECYRQYIEAPHICPTCSQPINNASS